MSRLDQERRFGAKFLLKQRAYHNDERMQGKKVRKLTLKSSVINKLKIVKLFTHTARTWSETIFRTITRYTNS